MVVLRFPSTKKTLVAASPITLYARSTVPVGPIHLLVSVYGDNSQPPAPFADVWYVCTDSGFAFRRRNRVFMRTKINRPRSFSEPSAEVSNAETSAGEGGGSGRVAHPPPPPRCAHVSVDRDSSSPSSRGPASPYPHPHTHPRQKPAPGEESRESAC
jgi:hypothetical protein